MFCDEYSSKAVFMTPSTSGAKRAASLENGGIVFYFSLLHLLS